MAKTVWRAFLKTAGILVQTKGVQKSTTPCNGSKMHFYAKTYRYIRGRMKLYETEADRAFYKLWHNGAKAILKSHLIKVL